MPTVTGTLTDIGLESLNGHTPVLIFKPSQNAASASGRIFATKPVEVTPNSAGAFTVELATTDDIIPAAAHWELRIGWRDPDGYAPGAGRYQHDSPTWKVRVPAEGGALVDMLDLPPRQDMIWVGNDEPPQNTGVTYTYWIDTSGAEPVLKGWQ